MIKTTLSLLLASLLSMTAQAQTGVTDKTILVGQFAPLTGPSSQLGERVRNGINAYFEQINSGGGVYGRKLSLVTRDDAHDPEKSKLAAMALINEDQVFALIGSVGSGTTQAVLPIVAGAKTPLVGPVTGADSLRAPFNRYVFHVRASESEEADRIAYYLKPLGFRKVAVVYQRDTHGLAALSAFSTAIQKHGLELVSTAEVEKNSKDVAGAVEKVMKADPNAIVQISGYQTAAAVIRAAKANGYRNQFISLSSVGSSSLAQELGATNNRNVVISQVVPFPFTPTSNLVRQYQTAMTTYSDGKYDFSSMEGYLIAKLFVDGLQRAGRNLSREGFVNALEGIKTLAPDIPAQLAYGPQSHLGTSFVEMTFLKPDGGFVR